MQGLRRLFWDTTVQHHHEVATYLVHCLQYCSEQRLASTATTSTIATMMILELPDETTHHILKFVHKSDIAALTKCMCVCKRWKNVGESILWRHIYIHEGGRHQRFYRTIGASFNELSYLVKSLTVRIDSFTGWFVRYPIAPNHQPISTFSLIVLSLPSLRSLSIKCDILHDNNLLHDLLRHVPSSLESFELDNKDGYAIDSSSPKCSPVQQHLCPLFSKILSSTKHFQVDAANICEDIVPELQVRDSAMNSQTINITVSGTYMRRSSDHRAHRVATKLSKLLQAQVKVFPTIQSAKVSDYLNHTSSKDWRTRHLSWDGIVVRDIKRNTTMVTPCLDITASVIDPLENRAVQEGCFFMRRRDPSSAVGFTDIFVPTFQDLLPAINPNGWVEDADLNLRFPRAFATSSEGKAGDFNWTPQTVVTLNSPNMRSRWIMDKKLYQHEVSADRPLLRPICHGGLDEVTDILREETQAELDASANVVNPFPETPFGDFFETLPAILNAQPTEDTQWYNAHTETEAPPELTPSITSTNLDSEMMLVGIDDSWEAGAAGDAPSTYMEPAHGDSYTDLHFGTMSNPWDGCFEDVGGNLELVNAGHSYIVTPDPGSSGPPGAEP